ncbi:hypothetical protein ACFYXD_35470 [Streptomyces platensis]|uniref:hypothetical protein n=1 Tax=Streptomyces platensis TaxID=58346 RepID=UPI0036A8C702
MTMGATTPAQRAAKTAWARRRRRLIAYGQWDPFLPAGPVRAHVHAVLDAGLPQSALAENVGVGVGSLRHLLYGTRGQMGDKVTRELGEALLGYWPKLSDFPDHASVDGTGTRRRVQALAVVGWPQAVVAERLGRGKRAFGASCHAARVSAGLAKAVALLYDELWKQRPEDHGVASWVADRCRRAAARDGFIGPLGWEDEAIDDPNAEPVTDSEPETADGDAYVDEAAVLRYLNTPGAQVTDADRLAAIVEGLRRGMAYIDFDALHNLEKGATQKWVDARRLHAKRHGLEFPVLVRAGESRHLTKGEVVSMRERAAAGETQVQLALAFGVATSTVARVVRGERYADYGGPISKRTTTQPSVSSRRLFNRGQAAFAKAS